MPSGAEVCYALGAMIIAQISDSHLITDDPARIGDLERVVADVNALTPQPDLVFHTGDVVHNGTADEYALARQILDRLRAPLTVIPGNRDSRAGLQAAFADGMEGAAQRPFVQYAFASGGLRLVALDTLSEQSNKGAYCDTRHGELERLLEADQDTPTAIFMHHQPFEVTAAPDPFQFETRETIARFTETVARHPQIRRIFCGHIHRTASGTIAGVPASTITALAVDLRKGEGPSDVRRPPVYALHRFDPAQGFTSSVRTAGADADETLAATG